MTRAVPLRTRRFATKADIAHVTDPAAPASPVPRRAATAVLVFLATLPLQFQSLVALPLGEVRFFHLGAVAMVLLSPGSLRAVFAVLRDLWVMIVAMLVLSIIAVVSFLDYGGDVAQPVQHLFYCGVGIVFLAVMRDAMGDDSGRALLVWSAPITVAVTFVELVRRLLENGLDPGTVLRATLFELNPNLLIYGVFRQGTDTGEVIQSANIRHEIMAAVVVSVLVTLLGRDVRRTRFVIATAAAAAGGALVIMSLSRSILLPLLLVALGAGIRVWLRSVLTTASVLGVSAVVLAIPVVGSLLYTRFAEDTGSYEERVNAFSYSSDELLMRIIGGGPPIREADESTHTLVFDVLFQAGWLAGLAAVVVVCVLARYTLAAYSRYFQSGSVTELVAFAAGTLAIVRAFTIGGGWLHQVEWVEVGLLLALAAGVGSRAPRRAGGDRRTARPLGSPRAVRDPRDGNDSAVPATGTMTI